MNAMFTGLALVIMAPALKAPKNEPPPIVGLWVLTEYTQNGAPISIEEGTSTEFCADGKRIWTDGREVATDYERGYKLIPKATPPALDLTRADGAQQPLDVFPCIYKIDGDTLVLTIGDMGTERPTKHGEGWRVMKYKRAKKE
jgi:uncharacterized protein (TIGR03067 family)